MPLLVIFLSLLVGASTANPVREVFHLKDLKHNQYLNVENPGSKILHLVEIDEDIHAAYSAHKSKISEVTWFKGCSNSIDLNEEKDTICIHGHRNLRLYYDTKHKVFIVLDKEYKTEDRLICYIKTTLEDKAEIECGQGFYVNTRGSHRIMMGSHTDRTLYKIEKNTP